MAIEADGSTEFLTATGWDYDLPTNVSISFWCLLQTTSDRNAFMGARGTSTGGWKIFATTATDYLQVTFTGDTTNNFNREMVLNVGSWDHICIVKSGTTLKPYLNGVEKTNATGTSYVNQAGLRRDIEILTFGEGSRDEYWDGAGADIAVWESVLTGEQIAALAAGIDPRRIDRANMIHFWRMHLGDLRDQVGDITLAKTGALTQVDHPSISRFRPRTNFPAAGGGSPAATAKQLALLGVG